MTRLAPRPRHGPAPVPLLGWLAALLAMPLAALAQARSVLPERLGGAIGDPGSAFQSLPQLSPAPPPSRKFTLPPAPPPIKPPTMDGPRVLVRQIRVLGNTVLPESVITEIAAPFLGRELDAGDLEELRYRLTRAYVARGYVNSGAVLPDQRVENGLVTYRVIEGRLTDVAVTGTKWLSPSYVRERLERAAGPPVNIDAIERQVQLLLQDPVIGRMNVELVPGVAPGEARLLASVTESKMYSVSTTIANDEPPDVGSVRGELRGVLRDLTGWGDVLALRYGRTAGVNEGGVAWTLPVTAADTAVTVGWDYDGAGVVSAAFSGLGIRSTTKTFGIAVGQPLYRSPQQALTLSLALDHRTSDTFLLNEPFSFSPGFVNGHAAADILRLSLEWADRGPEQAIVLRSALSRGLPLPGATNSSQQPNADFTIWLGQAQYVHALPGASQVIARADAQLSSSPLFPFEQIAIGGPTTVRGYVQNLEVRDNGVIASLEGRIPILTLPLPRLSAKEGDGLLQLAPFFDAGSGWNTRSPTPQPRTISSIGAGLRWSVSERILAQIYYGHALNHVRQPGHSLQEQGIYFQLTATPW